jgi:hypothetical protein
VLGCSESVRFVSQISEINPVFILQAVLHSNGDILFAYKELPIKISNIAHEEHPVKVGLSDAYIIDRTIFCKSTKSTALLLKYKTKTLPYV